MLELADLARSRASADASDVQVLVHSARCAASRATMAQGLLCMQPCRRIIAKTRRSTRTSVDDRDRARRLDDDDGRDAQVAASWSSMTSRGHRVSISHRSAKVPTSSSVAALSRAAAVAMDRRARSRRASSVLARHRPVSSMYVVGRPTIVAQACDRGARPRRRSAAPRSSSRASRSTSSTRPYGASGQRGASGGHRTVEVLDEDLDRRRCRRTAGGR